MFYYCPIPIWNVYLSLFVSLFDLCALWSCLHTQGERERERCQAQLVSNKHWIHIEYRFHIMDKRERERKDWINRQKRQRDSKKATATWTKNQTNKLSEWHFSVYIFGMWACVKSVESMAETNIKKNVNSQKFRKWPLILCWK